MVKLGKSYIVLLGAVWESFEVAFSSPAPGEVDLSEAQKGIIVT